VRPDWYSRFIVPDPIKFCFPVSLLAIILILASPSLFSQVPDSTKSIPTVQSGDTTKVRTGSGVDTVVNYSARDSIVYSMRTRFMDLYGKTDLQYQTLSLKAEQTSVNWNTMTLTAHGIPDTSDKKGKKTIGSPIMKDGGETYNGSHISYNFQTKKGKINVAQTKMDNGYYHGIDIKKDGPDVLYVADGRFTTCDEEDPHYYFFSPKMKVLVHDKVIAEPVYFYVADVPLFVLPFGVFPSHGGRSSGLIAPAYGEDNRRGKFLSHFGYYWAASECWDVATAFDWYTRGGWLNRSNVRYNLRYDFNGSLTTNFTNLTTGDPADPTYQSEKAYNVVWRHHQDINPSTQFDANFTFTTGKFYQQFSNNLDDVLRQNIVSTATLTKTWEESNSRLSIYAYRDQNLTSGAISEQLPSISFTQGQIFPFKPKSKSRGLSTETSAELPWYDLISLSYSGQGSNTHVREILTPNSIAPDSTVTIDKYHYGINHSIVVNMAPKLGYFTLTPSINYNEKWYPKHTEYDTLGNAHEVSGFRAVRTYNLGLAASTKFFGLFQPGIFGITGFRHTVTPTLAYTFQPDFSTPGYGYYGTYTNVNDTTHRINKYSLFANEVYGGAPSGRSQSLSMNVGNVFEMKYATSDTANKEEKLQLLNLNASLSYNFAADSLRFSPITLSYRTELGKFLSVSATTTHNLYVFDENAGTRVNRFLLSDRGKIADLTSVSFGLTTSLSGQKKQPKTDQSTPASVQGEQDKLSAGNLPMSTNTPRRLNQGIYDQEEADFSIPWNISLSYSFSQFQNDPRQKSRSSALSSQLSFNLTDKWQISTGAYYDFVRDEFSAPSVSVTRDLHCWTMNFTWRPTGIAQGFLLELKVKAPELQDLKITKQGSARAIPY
jgi:lipopolysaccharide assembly outer membrane protein LptD (OstA)